jgi:hypothetical protein
MSKQKRPQRRNLPKIIKAERRLAIKVPPHAVPFLAVDHEAGLVHVVPVPREVLHEKSWWEKFVDWAAPAQ